MALSISSDINAVMDRYNKQTAANSRADSLEKSLKGDLSNASDEELMNVCKSFEAYLLEQVLTDVKEAIVPKQEKENPYLSMFGDKLYEEYHAVLDKLYKELNITVAKRRLTKFKDGLKQVAERGESALDNERARLMRQYEQLKQEVQTYENNLGFLNASSKKGNSLIDEMNRKVQKLKDEMNLVREKIKAIDAENKE